MTEHPLCLLEGEVITAIFVSEGESYMRFETQTGSVGMYAEGDCCSESWFADFTGVDALLGQQVEKVEVVDLPPPEDDRSRQQEDQAYGFKFTTKKGYADLVFRNSSNGYYGGWAVSSEAKDATVPITEDWSA